MQNIKDAYSTLGVRENATKDEITKKYRLILRKYEQRDENGTPLLMDKEAFDEISKAYDLLMGYEPQETKKRNSTLLKIENFIYYHKVHVLVGIFILFVAAVALSYFLGRVTYDLRVVFRGDYYYQEMKVMEDEIKNSLPDIKQPQVTINPTVKIDASIAPGYRIKETAQLSNGDIDVLVLDKDSFDSFVKLGVLSPLDEFLSDWGIASDSSKVYKAKGEDGKTHVYGIDLYGNKMVMDTEIKGNTFIASICQKNKNSKNTLKFMKLLLKEQEG